MNKLKQLLEQSAPFDDLEEAALQKMVEAARERHFETGETLFQEMTAGDEIYFIVEGSVRISVELASAYHLVEEITGGPGDLLGEGRFIAEGPRPATVTATSRVSALEWDVGAWKAIADEFPRAGYFLAVYSGRVLFERVQELKNHLLDDMAWGLE